MFELNGSTTTLDELKSFAEQNNIDFDTYMSDMKASGMVEVKTDPEALAMKSFYEADMPGFSKTGMTIVNVVKAIPQLLVDSKERKKTAEYMANRIDNIPETLQSALYSAQSAAVDLYTADIDGIPGYGNEKQQELREQAEKKIISNYDKIQKLDFKDTGKGIVAGATSGSPSDLLAGVFGAGISMVETAIPAALTFGASLPVQVAAPMYTAYNEAKAKQIYGDDPEALQKLVNNNQTEIAIPLALGAVATGLEYVGLKGVTKYIQSVPGKGTQLAKLLWTGSGEGFTEVAQLGTEKLNEGLGLGKSVKEASIDSWDAMTSDEGLEMWFNGFLGAGQMSIASRAVNRALRSNNASVKELNEKIDNLSSLNNKKYNTRNKEVKESIGLDIKDAEQDLKNYIQEKRKISEILNEDQKQSLINIINEKDNIKSKAESLKKQLNDGVISSGEFGYAIRGLNNQDKKLSENIELINETAKEQLLQTSLEATKEKSEKLGLEQIELSQEEFTKQFPDDADSDGAIVGGKIYINREVARQTGAIGVGSHELLHGIIGNSYKKLGKEDKIKLNTEFLNLLGTKEKQVILNRLASSYDITGDKVFETEELFTAFSDAIIDGGLPFNEGVFGKIKNTIHKVLNKFGYQKEFESARQTYNFLKDYSKNIKEGKLTERAADFAKQDPGVKGTRTSKTTSATASDKVQSIYENEGAAGAFDIISEFKPIVSKIVEKRSEAPGFDRQLLTDEIETGKRGILDLIAEYKPESGVPLAAFINKYLPSRAIEASRRVLGEEFTEDVTEAKGVMAEEVAEVEVETKPKKKKIVLAERLGVTDKVSKAIEKIVPDLDVDKLTFKTLKNKVPEITGKLFGISSKKLISLANITKKELQSAQMFINKNADVLIAMLPEGATASGTATGVPGSLLKAFYTKTDRAKAAKTGSKAGLAIQEKNDINKREFLETFGIIDGKPDRTDRNTSARVLALANLTGKMITNQAVRAELAKTKIETKALNKIAEGKSELMFSKSAKNFNIDGTIDNLLNSHIDKVGRKTFKLRTDQDVDLYIQALINDVLPLMPRQFWFGKKEGVSDTGSEFTPSDRVIDIPKSRKQERKDLYVYYKQQINALNQLDDSFFGDSIGVDDFSRPSYSSLFEGKKGVQVEKIKQTNKRTAKIHEALWSRIYEAIQKDPTKAAAIGSYFKLVSKQNNHWHRAAAEIIGYSKNPKGTAKKLYEYEHAMPATASYLYLIDAALNGYNFKATYNPVMDNFKLIALDAAENQKLNDAGLADRMPDDWNTIDNKWWERYFNDQVDIDPNSIVDLNGKTFKDVFSIPLLNPNIKAGKTNSKAIKFSRSSKNKPKGITVLDFDDTLATTESLVKYTTPDGKTGTLNAEQFASTYQDLLDQGYTFDFSDFNKVVKGKLAPLFNKAIKLQGKFGPENMFVLTARPPQAQKAIFDFLKANGLNIPLENITGLGNSTAEAKALWIADKVGEGYNDFYFADDALQNVQAVKNMLDQFDVKSKVQQAKVKFSKSINENFNAILQDVTGIESKKRFSDIKARKRGADKGKFRFFIPPSHEDFVGLLYNFIGKGRLGNEHRDFFEQALVRPLNRAYRELNTARQSIANDYKNLNKQFPSVKDKLTKKTPDGDFMYQDAVRVYLWDKHGNKVPGLSETDQAGLVELVKSDPEMQAYADAINTISKREDYVAPTESWEAGDIRTDLDDATGRVGRVEFFTEFFENADIIFSQENMNKIEAAYGVEMVEALKDMLYRTKTGRNRPSGQNAQVNKFMNWLNGAVASTMFFNIRSAVLQQMSLVNFINFSDNNILSAAKAFANQKQYWSDWSTIFNSDFMKQRRGGIKTDVNGAELAASVKDAKKPVQALIKKLLELGFLPTQIGDNIAIATGGSTFYRNRINTYLKQGLSKKEAESKAFVDFQVLAEATQQSARPDMVSQQQASPLGKIILAFQNVTSQFNRLGKKAFLDIKNRRITPGNTTQTQSDVSNLSRIAYYFAIQNLIFYALQSALFMAMFSDDEEDERFLKKKERMISGSIDSVLRGSGVWGAALATLKNMALKRFDKKDKKGNSNVYDVMAEALQVSPPIGIKARKLVQAERDLVWKKKIIDEMETFDIENPVWSAYTSYIEGLTNVPVNRLYNKTLNVRESLNNQNSAFERLLMFSGWSKWNLGIEDAEKSKAKSKFGTKKRTIKKRTIKKR